MISLRERRKVSARPLSVMVADFSGASSPVLQGCGTAARGRPASAFVPASTSTPNKQWGADSSFDIEITELSRSPTDSRRKVWSFSSYSPSPFSSRQSSPDLSRPQGHASSQHSSPSPSSSSSRSSSSNSSSPSTILRKFSAKCGTLKTEYSKSAALSDRRYLVISELIHTERKYICNLETLLNTFLPALEHVVSPRDLRLIFPAQLEPLLDDHRKLLSRLEERMGENTPYPGIVGDVFGRFCNGANSEVMHVYSAYLNEFKVAMKTLVKYEQSSSQFREILHMCQQSPECEGLSLSSYLLTPVQRLPRYELLLKEIMKHTPLDHPDSYYVGNAVEKLHDELHRLNQSIKSCQLACSVTRVRNPRKTSFRFSKARSTRVRPTLTRLRRHVSTANIDEYSSGGESSSGGGSERVPRPMNHRHRNILDTSGMYRSEESLVAVEEEEDDDSFHALALRKNGKAVSCSDLLLEFAPDAERRRKAKHVNLLEPLPSVPGTPEPVGPPSLGGSSSVLPVSSEDSGGPSSLRFSLYSTASSTSGIGSIDQSQLDLTRGSITPTDKDATPTNSNPSVNGCALHRTFSNSSSSSSQQQHQQQRQRLVRAGTTGELAGNTAELAGKRRTSWIGNLMNIRRRSTLRPSSSVSRLEISEPSEFRHVQHGFANTSLDVNIVS